MPRRIVSALLRRVVLSIRFLRQLCSRSETSQTLLDLDYHSPLDESLLLKVTYEQHAHLLGIKCMTYENKIYMIEIKNILQHTLKGIKPIKKLGEVSLNPC